MSKIDEETIIKRMRKARIDAGVSCKQVAEKMQVSSSYISNFEHMREKLNVKTLVAYADILGVTVDSLIGNNISSENQVLNEGIELICDLDTEQARVATELLRILSDSPKEG